MVAVALAAVLAAAVLAGCSSGDPASARTRPTATTVTGYWTQQRLLDAQPWETERAPGGLDQEERRALSAVRVGALFVSDASGDHFCTASVVSSPGRDLLVTAAHCINAGNGGGYRRDIVFIPSYHEGKTPFGVWTPARLLVAPGWASSSDPALDVGFVVLKPYQGRNIEDVLGANTLDFNPGYQNLVRVTGYPADEEEPVTCQNWTKKQSADQLRFDCNGFTGGTSGSPWVTKFDSTTGTGRIVGVLGGYQEGGSTSDISYSSYLGDAIRQLYDEAVKLTRVSQPLHLAPSPSPFAQPLRPAPSPSPFAQPASAPAPVRTTFHASPTAPHPPLHLAREPHDRGSKGARTMIVSRKASKMTPFVT
jgi:V8-like Glu-specific endopeptidase